METSNKSVLYTVDELAKKRITMETGSMQHHIAAIINPKTILAVAIGANSSREAWCGCCYGRHAESDAILSLPPNKTKRVITVDIISIRVTKANELRMSQPCSMCVKYMCKIRGYVIRNVYYSDSEGKIIKVKLRDIIVNNQHSFSSRFRNVKQVKLDRSYGIY